MTVLEPTVLPLIENALKDLRYGSVQLIIHNGLLVRVERVERIHLSSASQKGDIADRADRKPMKICVQTDPFRGGKP